MNAPDQLNSFHLTSYTTYSELLKTQHKKKRRKTSGVSPELNSTCMKNYQIENKSLLTAIKKKEKKKSVWHINMEFSDMKNKVNFIQTTHLRKTFFCFFLWNVFPFFEFFFSSHLPLNLQWEFICHCFRKRVSQQTRQRCILGEREKCNPNIIHQ